MPSRRLDNRQHRQLAGLTPAVKAVPAIPDPRLFPKQRLEQVLNQSVPTLRSEFPGHQGDPTVEMVVPTDLCYPPEDWPLRGDEKGQVDQAVRVFMSYHRFLSAEQKAALWERMVTCIDVNLLHEAEFRVSRGFRWEHKGKNYYVYQGQRDFNGDGRYYTLLIAPDGTVTNEKMAKFNWRDPKAWHPRPNESPDAF